jgi:hypothetical protein
MESRSYRERHALFRAHASALLRGDGAETAGLQRLIRPEHALAHHVFALALFVTCVEEHFGEELDWAKLDVLVEHVRRTAPGVSPLKTEALVRACYDEPELLLEVSQSEQIASTWAVCGLLVGEPDDEALTALFDRAEEFGRWTVRAIFSSSRLHAWRDEAEREEA